MLSTVIGTDSPLKQCSAGVLTVVAIVMMGLLVCALFFLYFYCSMTVIPIFLPLLPLPYPHPPPTSNPPHHRCLCPWVFYTCSLTWPFLFFPQLPNSPLATVSLFFTSMSLVLFCSFVCFVDQVPLIGETIWYLPSTTWLTSLSIMFSSSIQAVMKGKRSSFFLPHSIPLCKCTTGFWPTHLSDGHLGCF